MTAANAPRLRIVLLAVSVLVCVRLVWYARSVLAPNLPYCPSGDRRSLRIYVYDIPASILAIPEKKPQGWESLEFFVWQALLLHPSRTLRPEEADIFFIPHLTTLHFHRSHLNSSVSSQHFADVLSYVLQQPQYNASNGLNHLIAWSHDSYGNILNSTVFRMLPNSFKKNVVHILNQGDDGALGADFYVARDIVALPPSWTPDSIARPKWSSRTWLAYFRGTIHKQLSYSGGVRQRLVRMFENSTSVLFREGSAPNFTAELMDSKFCLHIRGWHVWSERLGTLINGGCVPVIIADRYALPYWQIIDWREFSLRVSEQDALVPGKLEAILRNVSAQRANEMEARLQSKRFSMTFHLPPQPGDALDSILSILALKTAPLPPINARYWH